MWKKLKEYFKKEQELQKKYTLAKLRANGLQCIDYELYRYRYIENLFWVYYWTFMAIFLGFLVGVIYTVLKLVLLGVL